MTSSTVSSESAPRSSTKDESLVTSSSLTPNCSATIALTRCSMLLIGVGVLCKEKTCRRPGRAPAWGAYSNVYPRNGPIALFQQSNHVHTAIYVHRFASDVRRLRRGEK